MTTHEDVPPRIPPPMDDANRTFWTAGAEGRLMMSHCDACERFVHPPTDTCPQCGGTAVPREVSGSGAVYTFTVNRHPFHPDVPPPYVVALVELDEQPGLRFTTNIVDCDVEDVEIGMRVHVRFEPAGEAWVPVFAPM